MKTAKNQKQRCERTGHNDRPGILVEVVGKRYEG